MRKWWWIHVIFCTAFDHAFMCRRTPILKLTLCHILFMVEWRYIQCGSRDMVILPEVNPLGGFNSTDIFLWTPIHRSTSVSWPAKTYIHWLCADIGCCLADLLRAMPDRDGWWEKNQGNSCCCYVLMIITQISLEVFFVGDHLSWKNFLVLLNYSVDPPPRCFELCVQSPVRHWWPEQMIS